MANFRNKLTSLCHFCCVLLVVNAYKVPAWMPNVAGFPSLVSCVHNRSVSTPLLTCERGSRLRDCCGYFLSKTSVQTLQLSGNFDDIVIVHTPHGITGWYLWSSKKVITLYRLEKVYSSSFKVKVSRKFISDFNSNLRETGLVLMVMSHCHPLALILLHVTEMKTLVDCLS